MPNPDPHFSHPSQEGGEEVFERLLNDVGPYIPYWKTLVLKRLGWEQWPGEDDCPGDYSFIEDCFDGALQEFGIDALSALLDPHLQIEVVPRNPDSVSKCPGAPSWAFPVHRQEWITEVVDVHPSTIVLLLLFQSDIELLPEEEVLEDLKHELGHALLYLRDPEATNDCPAADNEWERATRMEDFIG